MLTGGMRGGALYADLYAALRAGVVRPPRLPGLCGGAGRRPRFACIGAPC